MSLATERPDLLPALKTAINAENDAEFVVYRNNGQTTLMAGWYSKPHASVKAWNANANWRDIFDAIEGAKYTPSVANLSTQLDAGGTNRLLSNLCKLTLQQNMLLAMANTFDARDAGTIDAVLDSVTGIYSLQAANVVAPGGVAGVNVANKAARAANRGEAIFGGNDVIKGTVTAKILTWEGTLLDTDISAALSLP